MDNIKNIISKESSLMNAFALMDKEQTKVLFIMEGKKLIGLISAGDIQRAILKNVAITESVMKGIRKEEFIICKDTDSLDAIKDLMLKLRLELMPIVNENGELVNVYYWDDFFTPKKMVKSKDLEGIPLFVMAGGFGTRLKPITNVLPKPLIPLTDKPLIVDIIEGFGNYGISDVFISLNYKKELIEFILKDELASNYNVQYVHEDTPLGTAGSMSLLDQKFDSTFFLTNCDILINEDYRAVYDYHKSNNNKVTMIASMKRINIPYGTIETGMDGSLIEMKEKPEWMVKINTGVYILEPEIFNYLQKGVFKHITTAIEEMKSDGLKIGVYPISEGSWTDIGEWPEYLKHINVI